MSGIYNYPQNLKGYLWEHLKDLYERLAKDTRGWERMSDGEKRDWAAAYNALKKELPEVARWEVHQRRLDRDKMSTKLYELDIEMRRLAADHLHLFDQAQSLARELVSPAKAALPAVAAIENRLLSTKEAIERIKTELNAQSGWPSEEAQRVWRSPEVQQTMEHFFAGMRSTDAEHPWTFESDVVSEASTFLRSAMDRYGYFIPAMDAAQARAAGRDFQLALHHSFTPEEFRSVIKRMSLNRTWIETVLENPVALARGNLREGFSVHNQEAVTAYIDALRNAAPGTPPLNNSSSNPLQEAAAAYRQATAAATGVPLSVEAAAADTGSLARSAGGESLPRPAAAAAAPPPSETAPAALEGMVEGGEVTAQGATTAASRESPPGEMTVAADTAPPQDTVFSEVSETSGGQLTQAAGNLPPAADASVAAAGSTSADVTGDVIFPEVASGAPLREVTGEENNVFPGLYKKPEPELTGGGGGYSYYESNGSSFVDRVTAETEKAASSAERTGGNAGWWIAGGAVLLGGLAYIFNKTFASRSAKPRTPIEQAAQGTPPRQNQSL